MLGNQHRRKTRTSLARQSVILITIHPDERGPVREGLEARGYAVLRRAVTPEVCDLATKRLRRDLAAQRAAGAEALPRYEADQEPVGIRQGAFHHDPQCPLSYAIYNDELLSFLHGELRAPLSHVVARELVETYVYARVYQPGEVLKPHVDREACEFSATLTLGCEGEVWPIHIGRDSEPLILDVGDLAVYLGHRVVHWRDPYIQGQWQTQAFFHYVDANGPCREFARDARPEDHGRPETPE